LLGSDVCFDKQNLTGRGIIAKKLYEGFEGYKPVLLNMTEFRNISTEINKINYLSSKGIKLLFNKYKFLQGIANHNIKGVYDFSQVKKIDDQQVEEKGIC